MQQPDSEYVEFVRARYPAVLARARLLTGDTGAAEDLTQDAFAALLLGWRRGVEDPEHYVQRVLTRRAVSRWRRSWHREEASDAVPERSGDDETARRDDRELLLAALARLPRRQRAVVVLRYVEDLSHEQVAELMGVSASTVRSQAVRALAALRRDPSLAAWPDGTTTPTTPRHPEAWNA